MGLARSMTACMFYVCGPSTAFIPALRNTNQNPLHTFEFLLVLVGVRYLHCVYAAGSTAVPIKIMINIIIDNIVVAYNIILIVHLNWNMRDSNCLLIDWTHSQHYHNYINERLTQTFWILNIA